MTNILAVVVRFLNKPIVHVLSGIIIIVCGLMDIEEGIGEFMENGAFAADRIGLLFLGISTLLMKGSITFIKFFESTAKGASAMPIARFRLVHSLHKFTEHWLFELCGGVLILVCGVFEFSENILKNSTQENKHFVWFFGFLAIGVVKVLTILPEAIEAIILLSHVKHQKGWSMKTIHYIGSKLRKPGIEISLAVFLVFLGIFEELLLPVLREGYAFQLGMHHGIAVFGITQIAKILPDLIASKMLIQDAFSEAL